MSLLSQPVSPRIFLRGGRPEASRYKRHSAQCLMVLYTSSLFRLKINFSPQRCSAHCDGWHHRPLLPRLSALSYQPWVSITDAVYLCRKAPAPLEPAIASASSQLLPSTIPGEKPLRREMVIPKANSRVELCPNNTHCGSPTFHCPSLAGQAFFHCKCGSICYLLFKVPHSYFFLYSLSKLTSSPAGNYLCISKTWNEGFIS